MHLADRDPEALEAIKEAEKVVEQSEERQWCAELCRLRGILLASIGAEEAQIEASFLDAIQIAKEQKSISLEERAERTYAEYCRQKASGGGTTWDSDCLFGDLCGAPGILFNEHRARRSLVGNFLARERLTACEVALICIICLATFSTCDIAFWVHSAPVSTLLTFWKNAVKT